MTFSSNLLVFQDYIPFFTIFFINTSLFAQFWIFITKQVTQVLVIFRAVSKSVVVPCVFHFDNFVWLFFLYNCAFSVIIVVQKMLELKNKQKIPFTIFLTRPFRLFASFVIANELI